MYLMDSKSLCPHGPPMADGSHTGKNSPTARRMRLLRESLGYDTALAFSAFLGVSAQRWGNVETGMPLSNALALLLVKKVPGLTLDWLYLGKPDGLPFEMARKLGELESETTAKARR